MTRDETKDIVDQAILDSEQFDKTILVDFHPALEEYLIAECTDNNPDTGEFFGKGWAVKLVGKDTR